MATWKNTTFYGRWPVIWPLELTTCYSRHHLMAWRLIVRTVSPPPLSFLWTLGSLSLSLLIITQVWRLARGFVSHFDKLHEFGFFGNWCCHAKFMTSATDWYFMFSSRYLLKNQRKVGSLIRYERDFNIE